MLKIDKIGSTKIHNLTPTNEAQIGDKNVNES